jgi:ubiquinone/menaquinone biosynthesis C-methylase UbiE
MELATDVDLDNSLGNIAELDNLINGYVKDKNFDQALIELSKILDKFPASIYHLYNLRNVLHLAPLKMEYKAYFLFILNYKIFDHKFLLTKVLNLIFELETTVQPQNNPLLHNALKVLSLPNMAIENLLCASRHESLQLLLQDKLETFNVELIIGMAQQAYLNEYVWSQDVFSTQQIINLLNKTTAFVANTKSINYYHKCVVLLACCYFSLPEIIAYYPLIGNACQADNDLLTLYQTQIASLQEEEQLMCNIVALTTIDPSLSAQVRAQYEQYPYPRWLSVEIGIPHTFSAWLKRLYQERVELFKNLKAINVDKPEILIAGCGTGSQPLQISQIVNAHITALDLSLSSLAYATRQTNNLNIKNISYFQGDLTKVEQINKKFDYIECIGVLHHTRNIENSLRKLCSALKPFGIMRLGLYSSTARASLKVVKQFVRDNEYTPDINGVRKMRQDIKERLHIKEFLWTTNFNDFFTTSMCIDLLFHTHELTTSIPQIKQMLAKNNLQFIGFDFEAESANYTQYRELFPEDKLMHNLNNWHKLEQLNPYMFNGMYCFSVQKTS